MLSPGPRIEAWFLRQWQRTGPAQIVLCPLSWLFGALAAGRRLLYRIGVLRAASVARPVIVVGNISVGGTGKTPLVIAMVECLKAAGIHAGVVTRGYRRESAASPPDQQDGFANLAGDGRSSDEAMLLARRTGVPVVASADRVGACAQMIARDPQVQVIVCDDGLQHYRLRRDLEICVIDGARGVGNGALLPAGPLREPASRLSRVDAIVINRTLSNLGGASIAERRSAAPLFAMTYGDERLVSLSGQELSVAGAQEAWRGMRMCAAAGIGHPQRFFSHLARLGFQTERQVVFPDHHPFTPADINDLPADLVLVTEKDAVKLALLEASLRKPVWALRVSAQLPANFDEFLLAQVKRLLAHHVDRTQTA